MTSQTVLSRRLLQIAVAIGGLVPVGAGLAGVLAGSAMTGASVAATAAATDLDSHMRYLSGLLLGIGLAYWASIPRIQAHRGRFLLLTLIVAAGGLARLLGVLLHGWPGPPMLFGLGMELVVTPLLCLWQRSLSATV